MLVPGLTDTTAPPELSDTQKDAVAARAGQRCQRQLAGCLYTCDYIEPSFKNTNDTTYIGRDVNSPDNWMAACTNCSYTHNNEYLPIGGS